MATSNKKYSFYIEWKSSKLSLWIHEDIIYQLTQVDILVNARVTEKYLSYIEHDFVLSPALTLYYAE